MDVGSIGYLWDRCEYFFHGSLFRLPSFACVVHVAIIYYYQLPYVLFMFSKFQFSQ